MVAAKTGAREPRAPHAQSLHTKHPVAGTGLMSGKVSARSSEGVRVFSGQAAHSLAGLSGSAGMCDGGSSGSKLLN